MSLWLIIYWIITSRSKQHLQNNHFLLREWNMSIQTNTSGCWISCHNSPHRTCNRGPIAYLWDDRLYCSYHADQKTPRLQHPTRLKEIIYVRIELIFHERKIMQTSRQECGRKGRGTIGSIYGHQTKRFPFSALRAIRF